MMYAGDEYVSDAESVCPDCRTQQCYGECGDDE